MSRLGARRRLAGSVAAATAAVVVLGGCSSSPATSPSTSVSTTTTKPATTVATTTTKSATGLATTTTTKATTLSTTCQPANLVFNTQTGNGAAGTISLVVRMQNTSTKACTLNGYPGMQLLSAQGSPIPTNVVRGGVAGTPSGPAAKPAALVTLAPSGYAAFTLSYEDVPTGTETTCPSSAKAQVTPPNDTAYAVVTLQIQPCSGGTVHVSPVYALSANP